ncbi:hypothetical protein CKO15_06345 [Halorhodospira abdelmalekii]|uniref:hypothetical protein n=1 Tax=Halorhodospira abdelmalekii TaxID=421629 RepID=UPI001903A468|nr:hypothetical protein [Halorhodospira abdelmalekii]MBK1734911.1 hypothetical protein [Halorhodospira abdelmalekii]
MRPFDSVKPLVVALIGGCGILAGCSSAPSASPEVSDEPEAATQEVGAEAPTETKQKKRGEPEEAEMPSERSCEAMLEGRRWVWADLSQAPERIVYYIGGQRCEPEH